MNQSYPCPNPICTHEFDPAQLAGAAAVTCPKCGMVIQLQATPAAPPVATQVTAAPPPGVPMARAVPRAQPVNVTPNAPVPQRPAAQPQPAGNPGGVIVRPRHLPKSNDWINYSLAIGGFLLIVALGLVGIMVWTNG